MLVILSLKSGWECRMQRSIRSLTFRCQKGQTIKAIPRPGKLFSRTYSNFAALAYPLNQLILDYDNSKTKPISWTAETVQAFEQIRKAISDCQKLYFMVDNAPTFLDTDASDYGIGAFLYQIVDGAKKPIAFLSKTLSKVQQRWSTIEKECYAIWYALRHWEFLLRDAFFTIRTDHRNLKYLNTNTFKVVRWKLACSTRIQLSVGRHQRTYKYCC